MWGATTLGGKQQQHAFGARSVKEACQLIAVGA